MSQEHSWYQSKEKNHISNHFARTIGASTLAALFMVIPARHSLEPDTAPYNPGVAMQETERRSDVLLLSNFYDSATGLTRDTGIDTQPCRDYQVCGVDLLHPFALPPDEKGIVSTGYIGGDTFAIAGPFIKNHAPGADKYRAQSMLRSDDIPVEGKQIIFDSAAGVEGKGMAAEILGGQHMLINDGVSLPDGNIVVSYQHTIDVKNPKPYTWYTDRSSLAISRNGGNSFEHIGPNWWNDDSNNDPYQMTSMQIDGEYIYFVSVKAGRQQGPMMLYRVKWNEIMNKNTYEYWTGDAWDSQSNAKPIMTGHFGEPSLRKLRDGTWILGYADYTGYPKIVTQIITDPTQGPEGQWSTPKVHLTARQLKNQYGGGIHPQSTRDHLILMISTWQTKGESDKIQERELVRYDVSHLVTTAE